MTTTGPADDEQHEDERPFWLTEPCPAWCDRLHHDWEPIEDRRHQSDLVGHVELSTMPADKVINGDNTFDHIPHCLELRMDQGYRENSPRLHLEEHLCRNGEFALTLNEAEQVATTLTRLITMGRTSQTNG